MMRTILLVGRDTMLLQTRAAVLRRMGVRVVDASTASVLARQAELLADLVVLCHSLSPQQADPIIHALRADWPATRILRIDSLSERPCTDSGAPVDAVSSCEPQQLIRAASALLEQFTAASSLNVCDATTAASLR